jgi:predicted phosphodiesterase
VPNDPGTARTERIFFIPDVHSPYEDKRATALMFDAMKVYGPDIVVVIGDFIDCFAVSNYSKDPRRIFGLEREVEHAAGLLDQIKAKRKIYVCGNHEDRLQRYLQDKAPELLPFVDIPRLLKLEERGWEWVPYKQSTKIGKLNITHDIGVSTRYTAYRVLETFQASVVTGHTHRLCYVVEGDAGGGQQVSAMFGWLGDVAKVDYMHRIKAQRYWAHGFGTGIHDTATGFVYLTAHPIVDYTVAIDGHVLRRKQHKAPEVLKVA